MAPSSKKAAATTGVLDYLQTSLPRSALLELYTEETRGRFVCRAVLQQLSQEAQQLVVRLSCTGGSFPLAGVAVWTSLNGKQQDRLLKELFKWAIIKEVTFQASGAEVTLTPQFAAGLQSSLCSLDASPWTQVSERQIEALERDARESHRKVTPEDLERHLQDQFDAVLHFLVGSEGKAEPPAAVVHFLMQTGLMQPDRESDYKSRGGHDDDAPLVITEKGYDFMLQDHHQQVWHFVVQYLRSLRSHENGEVLRREALLLLICLSFARVGEAYLASSLSKDARVMTKDLALFGLLYTRKIGKATIFYPTRVAMQLVGAPDEGGDSKGAASSMWSLSSKALEAALAHPTPHDSAHLAIIVQTNFQLCAYTTSELHVSMLGLFCDVPSIRRLPNMVFMTISRDAVKSAFSRGIQARQILRFLEKHAHPRLRVDGNSPVPANVVDQIWLWDRERRRVMFTEVYQHQCLMPGEFDAIRQYVMDRGAHAWSSAQRQQILIDYGHVEKVQNFARQWRAKTVTKQQAERE